MYVPPRRMIRWPVGTFGTICMIVFPIFWIPLGILLFAELFCLVAWLVVLVTVNAAILAGWLCVWAYRAARPVTLWLAALGLVAARSVQRRLPHPSHPGR